MVNRPTTYSVAISSLRLTQLQRMEVSTTIFTLFPQTQAISQPAMIVTFREKASPVAWKWTSLRTTAIALRRQLGTRGPTTMVTVTGADAGARNIAAA